jgi:uncharacterized Zn-finger protein
VERAFENFKEPWDRTFECFFCDKDFSSSASRRRHEKQFHIDKGDHYKCNDCDISFTTRDSLSRHIKENHKIVASVCECKCDTSYNVRETP